MFSNDENLIIDLVNDFNILPVDTFMFNDRLFTFDNNLIHSYKKEEKVLKLKK